ncbi:MAG: precorrin-2 dehydrogenase/sirohydrochlorin ferrochelatase family protein [Promethearchaeota archaeon]
MFLPTTLKLDGTVTIFGGGKVASRKVDVISKFTQDIRIIAEKFVKMPEFVEEIKTSITKSNFTNFLPKKISIIIVALSNAELNHSIANWANSNKILVNVVDDPDYCTIFFPAISNEGALSIAISTNGQCPFLSKEIRKEIDSMIYNKAKWGKWFEILAGVRKKMYGNPKKNEILKKIYTNIEIQEELEKENSEKAWELANIMCLDD